ncbi:MAG: SusD/RagB family nutrient-binding outer membrane lipoprotein [Flavobacteriaceae bacterium]
MKLFNKFFAVALGGLLVLSSCETAELDLTSNPNALSPDQADAEFFLSSIQEDFARWVHGMGDIGAELTRTAYMSGRTYNNVYSPSSLANEWEDAYQGMLQDIKLMNALASEQPYILGMGKVFQAYIMVTLVDYFGDVPYSEALKGDEEGNVILNPTVDSGRDVYDAAIALLESAKSDFGGDPTAPEYDFYYNGDASKWIKAANSILRKIYWVTDDARFDSASPYIEVWEDDFQFQWGTNQVQPDTRHPHYASNYTATGGGEYMPNWLMYTMQVGHGAVSDPRIKYYFYRQVDITPGFGGPANEEVLECGLPGYFNPYGTGVVPFCGLENGYWGRDHGNDNGIPPDGFLRTLRGVYPAGGRFDDDSFAATALGGGRGGNGITPIMLSSWMHFMRAERAGLTTAAGTDAMIDAIGESFDKVSNFDSGNPIDERDITSYANGFVDEWTAANAAERGNLWAKQFFISTVGNGNDAYNAYRKTGFPTDIQPNIENGAEGAFPTVMYYPSNYVSNNSNASQRSDLSERNFWNKDDATNLK